MRKTPLFVSRYLVPVCVLHVIYTVGSTRQHPAHPVVSVLILHPRAIQALWMIYYYASVYIIHTTAGRPPVVERHQQLPRALNSVGKHNSTRVDEGRKC